jgi:D-alanine-D-alanine ligase
VAKRAKLGKRRSIKVGVFLGGTSSEREISLKSGNAVFEALKRKGYKAVCIDAAEDMTHLIRDHKIEVAFVCLHGRLGEDGTIQGFLEVMGIPYTGSGVRASAVAMDKIMTKELLQYHGVPTPAFTVLSAEKRSYPDVKLPVVVKPSEQGSTIGITRVERRRELAPAVREALKFGPRVLLEQYIQGREVTAAILGDFPLPLVEVRPSGGFYDFAAKYTSGDTEYLVPAPMGKSVTKRIQTLALNVHRLLGCRGASRVDFMMARGSRPFVLEVNTIPGMTETSLLPKAAREAGIGFDDLVERILLNATA